MEVDYDLLFCAFAEEAPLNTTTLCSAIQTLQQNHRDTDGIECGYRVAHSLKGDAAIVNLGGISVLAGAVESVLNRLRDGGIGWDDELAELLVRAADLLRVLVLTAVAKRSLPEPDIQLIAMLQTRARIDP